MREYLKSQITFMHVWPSAKHTKIFVLGQKRVNWELIYVFQFHPYVITINLLFGSLAIVHLAYLGLMFDNSDNQEQVCHRYHSLKSDSVFLFKCVILFIYLHDQSKYYLPNMNNFTFYNLLKQVTYINLNNGSAIKNCLYY